MALHINLYHEILKQEEDRRRDPFKLAWLGGILVALVLVCFYFYRTGVVHGVESRAAGLQLEWTKLQPQAEIAKTNEEALKIQQKANAALIERLQSRFYWAPFLQEIAEAVPRNVQVITLTGELVARKGPLNLLLAGVAAGQQPRTVAETFRRNLLEKVGKSYYGVSATFDANSLEDSPEVIQYEGQSLPTATFKIRLHFFLDAAAAATPTPTPTPHAKKSRS